MNEIATKKVRFFLNLLDAQQQTGTGKRYISFPAFLTFTSTRIWSLRSSYEKKKGKMGRYNHIITNLTILRFHKYKFVLMLSAHTVTFCSSKAKVYRRDFKHSTV